MSEAGSGGWAKPMVERRGSGRYLHQQQHHHQHQHRAPLVLSGESSDAGSVDFGLPTRSTFGRTVSYDAASARSSANTAATTASCARSAASDSLSAVSSVSGSTEMAKKIFRAASAARRRRAVSFEEGSNRQQQHQQQQRAQSGEDKEQTAGEFARTASFAGYLHKLGSGVPTYKRRFFVLRPSTLLYYFVSPNDVEPRGCIDLEDVTVCEKTAETLSNGCFRFEIAQKNEDSDNNSRDGGDYGRNNSDMESNSGSRGGEGKKSRRILLEARSEAVGRRWIELLRSERLPHAKSMIEDARRRIDELTNELQDMKVLEEERDAALDDARQWKGRFESLDEGVRLLTKFLCRPPDEDVNSDQSERHKNDEQRLADLTIPDTGFASLRNATEQLRSNLAQTSKEASLALQDADVATNRVSDLEDALASAEARIQRLEQENSTLREESKCRKRDNKILVREVKNLRSAMEASKAEAEAEAEKRESQKMSCDEASRLISELEGHVATTLELQQRMLSGTTNNEELEPSLLSGKARAESGSGDGTLSSNGADENDRGNFSQTSPIEGSTKKIDAVITKGAAAEESPSPITPKTLSLAGNATKASLLDDGDAEDDDYESPEATAQIGEGRSVVSETGRATSRLTCSLVDVPSNNNDATCTLEPEKQYSAGPGDMYHLTFHSRHIGLQFQKVPASSASRGILSDAVAVDVDDGGSSVGDNVKMSLAGGDLGRIAAIARRSMAQAVTSGEHAKVAMPVDAVLVCGFHGYDDSVNKRRPNLGARLVAFDGVSVEIGEWTFDRIRRGIQSRDRPITLSFRNDNLSIQQREILTSAVAELQGSIPPQRHAVQQKETLIPTSTTRSSPGVDATASYHVHWDEVASARSFGSTSKTASSSHSYQHQENTTSYDDREDGTSNIDETVGSYQSFSDMEGASNALSSSLPPLISGLMPGIRSTRSSANNRRGQKGCDTQFTPKYMTRESHSLNSHHHHHDFQASLL